MPRKINKEVHLLEYESQEELGSETALLLEQAKLACNTSYSPYSGFQVGAALLLDNGKIITGSNQENASYPAGLCAERVAMFAAAAQNPGTKIKKIAIAARKKDADQFTKVTPCGSCRQVICEYENFHNGPIEIIMQAENGKVYVTPTGEMLLPFKFSNKNIA